MQDRKDEKHWNKVGDPSGCSDSNEMDASLGRQLRQQGNRVRTRGRISSSEHVVGRGQWQYLWHALGKGRAMGIPVAQRERRRQHSELHVQKSEDLYSAKSRQQ